MKELFYKTYGHTGKPLIILHGLFGMLDNWHSIAQKLALNFTVFTVDLRNHGHSFHSGDMNFKVMCDDIKRLMDHLQLPSADFIGHSMGGKLVMSLAGEYPQLINRAIIADIAPRKYPDGHTIHFKAMLDVMDKHVKSRKDAEEIMQSYIQETAIIQFLLKGLYRQADGTYTFRMNVVVLERAYHQISGEIVLDWPFSNPVLFLKGEQSNYIRESDEASIKTMFPNASFASVSLAGHWLHADNPEGFITEVNKFLLH